MVKKVVKPPVEKPEVTTPPQVEPAKEGEVHCNRCQANYPAAKAVTKAGIKVCPECLAPQSWKC